ncbi:MAG: hypothetical protein JNL13_07550 [Chitinophagaceae bacterium]|nr:hypothetical protein [Chitinophagaceae bacterium]
MMFFLSLGLTQPSGRMQHFDLYSMYAQCSNEDHDITPLDFVFEHLLNLESIVNLFEGEHEYHMGDHPHEPMQSAQSSVQVQLALPNHIDFEVHASQAVYPESITHTMRYDAFYVHSFYADVFRPPIAA